MADKPYTERTGGRYVRDPQTGKAAKLKDPHALPAPPEPEAPKKAPESPKSTKGN